MAAALLEKGQTRSLPRYLLFGEREVMSVLAKRCGLGTFLSIMSDPVARLHSAMRLGQ